MMEILKKKSLLKICFDISLLFSTFMKITLIILTILFFNTESIAKELSKIDSELLNELEFAPPNEHEQSVYVNDKKIIF